ncbi:MAG: hypothetical protein M3Y84_06580 [Acidobacteriota bacterium]|nr:hypothetical protein [Acidobacteriota bacterium]
MADPNSPDSETLYPAWQREYQAARSERDPDKLLPRVMAAETAIFKRQQALAQKTGHEAERQAIEDALEGLRIVKKDVLGFPDWEKG